MEIVAFAALVVGVAVVVVWRNRSRTMRAGPGELGPNAADALPDKRAGQNELIRGKGESAYWPNAGFPGPGGGGSPGGGGGGSTG